MLSFSSIKPRSNSYASMMGSRLGQYKSPIMSYMSPRNSALQNAITRPKSDFMSVAPPKKDYASFSDQDWLDYQANKKKKNDSSTTQSLSSDVSPDNQNYMNTSNITPVNKASQSKKSKKSSQGSDKGLLRNLIDQLTQSSSPANEQRDLTNEIAKNSRDYDEIAQNARQISDNYGKQIAEVGRLGAGAVAGNLSTGTNVVGSGNASIASQSASQRMGALASAQDTALKGIEQQLAAKGQTIQGLETALSGLGGIQSRQLGGLGAAAQYANPRQSGYVIIDPTTGQPIGGTQSGLNAAQLGGQYSAAETGGQTYAQNNQVLTGVQNQLDSLAQLINESNLNSLGINVGNATIQALEQNLSSSDYATLKNTLASINAALSQATGSPVDIEQLSSQQGTSLITTINNALQAARAQNQGYLNTSGGENNDPFGIGLI